MGLHVPEAVFMAKCLTSIMSPVGFQGACGVEMVPRGQFLLGQSFTSSLLGCK